MFQEKIETIDSTVDPLSPGAIESKITSYYASKRSRYPVNTNWISQLGHQCLRYLVYKRTKWEVEELPDAHLQMVFDEGNTQENAVLQLLNNAGFQVIQQQTPFNDKEHQISGKIDGRIMLPGTRTSKLLEIKSSNPYSFEKYKTINDLEMDPFTSRYIDQMTIYMHLEGERSALLLFKNKSNGRIKIFEIPYDENRAKSLLDKAKLINQHVENQTLPEKLNDNSICKNCGFTKICQPEIEYDPLMYLEDEDLLNLISRHEEIKPLHKEYESLHDELKAIVEKAVAEKFFIGNFQVIRKQYSRTYYNVPTEIKEPYAKKIPYYLIEITKIEKD